VQYIFRYDVKQKRSEAFRAWLITNVDALQASAQEGWTYLGTWFTVHGFGSYQVETRWEVEDYSSLGGGFGEDETRLIVEWMEFVDDGRPTEAYLMKSAADVLIPKGM
jgi:hypothetical protein